MAAERYNDSVQSTVLGNKTSEGFAVKTLCVSVYLIIEIYRFFCCRIDLGVIVFRIVNGKYERVTVIVLKQSNTAFLCGGNGS